VGPRAARSLPRRGIWYVVFGKSECELDQHADRRESAKSDTKIFFESDGGVIRTGRHVCDLVFTVQLRTSRVLLGSASLRLWAKAFRAVPTTITPTTATTKPRVQLFNVAINPEHPRGPRRDAGQRTCRTTIRKSRNTGLRPHLRHGGNAGYDGTNPNMSVQRVPSAFHGSTSRTVIPPNGSSSRRRS